jgi:DNA-directed RNA polymerase subunit RPC12/RpoP
MESPHSFDIAFLGLKDPSSAGRSRMILAMERLTGRSSAECQEYLSRVGLTIFDTLPVDQAKLIMSALDEAGAVCEIRPKEEAARPAESSSVGGMFECPSCGYVQKEGTEECSRCGVVFSKMEKDQIRNMQKNKTLEEAQQRAVQIRQEWDERAKQMLENRPLPEDAVKAFEKVLTQEEIPFMLLDTFEGPLLMTSRQILGLLDGAFAYLPYEIIKDVDYGGGLVVKKGHTRLVLHFHAPVPFNGKSVKSLVWQLTADAATNKEAIMDWAFARSYLCGSCGARDLDFRDEKETVHGRCMHCAMDHTIDLRNNIIKPLPSN